MNQDNSHSLNSQIQDIQRQEGQRQEIQIQNQGLNDTISNPFITFDNELQQPPIVFNVVPLCNFLPPLNQNINFNNDNKYKYKDYSHERDVIKMSTKKRNRYVNDYYRKNKKLVNDSYNLEKDSLNGMSLKEYKYYYYYKNVNNLNVSYDEQNKPTGSYYRKIRSKNLKGEDIEIREYINNPVSRLELTSDNLMKDNFRNIIVTRIEKEKRIRDWLQEIEKDDNQKIKNDQETLKDDRNNLD